MVPCDTAETPVRQPGVCARGDFGVGNVRPAVYDRPVIHRPALAFAAVAATVAAVSFVAVEVRQEREFRRLIAVGDAALADGQSFLAIEAFSGALAFKPESMLAHLKRGDAYRRRGELLAAQRDLTQAAALDETAPRPLELLGDVSSALGEHDRAADYYRRYLQLDNRAVSVLYKLALAYQQQGKPADAVQPLLTALELEPGLARAHYALGMVYRSLDRPTEALASLNRAIEIDAGFIAAREERAALQAERGRIAGSLQELEAIAALEPDRAERLVSLALAYARSGRRDSALATLGRAAERHPGSPLVSTALARVWLDSGVASGDPAAIRNAVEMLRPVAARGDAPGEAVTLYGRALLEAGRTREAERILQQAVRRVPLDPLAYRYLAEAARRLGNTPVADDARAKYAALTDRIHGDRADLKVRPDSDGCGGP